jgi:Tol biopolymer transport system component
MKWFIGVFSLIVFFLPTSKVCSEVVQFQQISFTTLCENFQPSISGNGKKVVFLSDCDIVLGSNIDQNYEVFLYDLDKKTFYQITKTEGQGKNNQPSINYDGNYVTFRSSADLVPEKNADGNSEIFLYHTNTHHLDQITHSISPSINSHPIISKNARFLVFLSSSKLGGEEEDPESPQVFIYERERKSFSPLTNPVLSPSFGSLKNHRETHRVGLSKDGTKVLIATSFPHTQDEPLKRSRLSLTLYDLNTKEAFSINPPENLGNFGHIHFPPSLNGDGSRGVFLVNQGQPVLDEKEGTKNCFWLRSAPQNGPL